MPRLAHCRSCGEPVIWAITARGKHMPLDADPVDARRGFRLEQGEELDDLDPVLGVPPTARFTSAPEPGEQLYQSHFSTCPNAAHHRRSA